MMVKRNRTGILSRSILLAIALVLALGLFCGTGVAATNMDWSSYTGATNGDITITDASGSTLSHKTTLTISQDAVLDFGDAKTYALTGSTSAGGCGGLVDNLVFSDASKVLTIKNLHIISSGVIDSSDFGIGGLFGRIESTGTLILENCSINGVTIGSSSGSRNVGGLVGNAYSANMDIELRNCTIENCNILSSSYDVGGLVGFASSASVMNMSGCKVAFSNITSGSCYVGGLVGCAYSASMNVSGCVVDRVYASGSDSVGGLVGGASSASMNMSGCMVNGSEVKARSPYVGGLVGDARSASMNVSGCMVEECKVWSSGGDGVGGLVGVAGSASVMNMSGCMVEECTVWSSGSYGVGGLVGNADSASIGFIGDGCWVNESWVSGTSGIGSLVGYSYNTSMLTLVAPQHSAVYSASTTTGNPVIANNDFDGIGAKEQYGSPIDRYGLVAGKDYGYISSTPGVVDSGTCGENLTWEFTDDGTLTIYGTGAMYDYIDCKRVPWFQHTSQMTTLVLSNGLTTIGNYAFWGCSGFKGSLTIPNSVTTIGNYAFWGCSGFTGFLTIPNSVTTIGNYAFSGCSGFTCGLTLSNNLTIIGDYAFYDNNGRCRITGPLTIPNSVTTIGAYAFSGCSKFSGALTLSNNLTTIGEYAFSDCSGFVCSLTIPNSVTKIDNGAFSGCSGFTGSLVLSDNLTMIGGYAFSGCNGLTGTLTLPNNIMTIDWGTFYGCSGFTGTLIIPNNVTKIRDQAFEGCSGFTGTLIIPNSVTEIGKSSFSGCMGISSVMIPSSVKSIGGSAFKNLQSNSVIYVACNPSLISGVYSSTNSIISDAYSNNAYRFTVPVSSFPSGFTLTNANAPSKLGWIFDGWHTNPEYTGDKVTTVTNGQTLYAKWHSDVPIIPEIDTFDLNRTSGESPLTVEFTYNIRNMTSGTVYLLDGNDVLTQAMYLSSCMVYTFTTPGIYTVHLKAVDEDQNEAVSDERTITVISIDDGLHVYPGWNVVSTPKKLSSAYDTAAELFAGVNTTGHAVLTYNAQTKNWEQVTASTKIEPLNAYWIYSKESKNLPYEFSSTVSSPAVKNVYKGWNAVGLSADEPMSAAETFGNTNWYTYLEWNATSQAFKSPLIKGGSGTHADTNLVSLWTGGWLFLNEDGTYMGFTA